MLYKIAINNSIHIPFLRKYFGFSFFNALPPPPPGSSGGGAKPLQEGAKSQGGGHCPICPPRLSATDIIVQVANYCSMTE